jgi:hypothetical protein
MRVLRLINLLIIFLLAGCENTFSRISFFTEVPKENIQRVLFQETEDMVQDSTFLAIAQISDVSKYRTNKCLPLSSLAISELKFYLSKANEQLVNSSNACRILKESAGTRISIFYYDQLVIVSVQSD